MVKQLFIVALLAACLPTLAELTASLSKEEISELESVRLTIRLDGGIAPRDDPDFSALESDFEVFYEGLSSTTKIINNNFSSVAEWKFVLRPKRIATLTIPPITIGRYTTEQLSLKVVPISDELSAKLAQEVFWETVIDRDEQYVHGGVHVERKLYYSNNVELPQRGRRGELPFPQDIDDAHIVDLGLRGSNWDLRNGRSYNVLIHESVIFAEKSGSITIPAASAVARINVDGRTISKVVRDDPVTVTIQPRPAEYPTDTPWLPATNLLVKDNLAALDLADLDVGDSFSRVITIEALESYSTGIPAIEFDLPEAIRTYPVEPEFENQVLGNKIIGIRTDEHAYVVTQAGEFGIPDGEIVWWNTNTKQVERTVVPGRTFTVQPNPDTPAGVTTTNNSTGTSEPTSLSTDPTPSSFSNIPSDGGLPTWFIVAAIAPWLLVLFFAGMWFRQRQMTPAPVSESIVTDRRVDSLLNSKSNSEVKEGMVLWLVAKLAVSRVEAIHLLQSNPTTAALLTSINAHRYSTSGLPVQLERSKINHGLREIEKQVSEQRNQTASRWQFYQPT